jgi:hypothetical protein
MNIFKNIKIILLFVLMGFLSLLPASDFMCDSKIQGRLNIVNGASAECVMHYFYANSGWIRIEGEVGRNGIDGLYYKKKKGVIREVLVSESKWNKAKLGRSGKDKLVRQMSQEWILRTLERLQKYRPQPEYATIRKLVDEGQYRARLFKMAPLGTDKVQITIYKIQNKGFKHFDTFLESRLKPIALRDSKNSFEAGVLNVYNDCRIRYLNRYFPMLTVEGISALLEDNYIQKNDMKEFLY